MVSTEPLILPIYLPPVSMFTLKCRQITYSRTDGICHVEIFWADEIINPRYIVLNNNASSTHKNHCCTSFSGLGKVDGFFNRPFYLQQTIYFDIGRYMLSQMTREYKIGGLKGKVSNYSLQPCPATNRKRLSPKIDTLFYQIRPNGIGTDCYIPALLPDVRTTADGNTVDGRHSKIRPHATDLDERS
jgi:hypothetical protein